jgi:hypothetical protein
LTTATDFDRYVVKVWELKRRANDDRPRRNQPALAITRADVIADPRRLRLTIPTLTTGAISPHFRSQRVRLVSASDHRLSSATFPLKLIPPNGLSRFGVA